MCLCLRNTTIHALRSLPSLSTMHARAHERGFLSFFFLRRFFLFYFFPLIFSRAALDGESFLSMVTARALRRKYYTLRSPSMIISLFSILYVHVTVSFVYCFAVVPTSVTSDDCL